MLLLHHFNDFCNANSQNKKVQWKALSLRYEYNEELCVNFTYRISHLSTHTCQWLKYHQKRESLCVSPDGLGQVIIHTRTHTDTNTHRTTVKMLLF